MKDLSAGSPRDEFGRDHSSEIDYLTSKDKEPVGARARIITAAMLALLPLIYFFPAVIGRITLAPGAGLTRHLGVRILIGQMLRDGHPPLWNPYLLSGTPLLASVYPGALYMPNWLFALFSPSTAMNIVVITTYHLAIIGTYLYGRRIGMTRVGALIAGVAFTFGGFMMVSMEHTSRIAAAAWLPWILLAIENLYSGLTWRWVALGAVFIALQLFAGDPQMSLYGMLVCGGYFLFSFYRREERETRRRFLFGAAAMFVCGMLLSAIQLLPERELLGMGERSSISYARFSSYSFAPANILTFIFPFFFGGASLRQAEIPYWGKWTIDESCGYFGLITLLLALIALFGARKRSLESLWGVTALVSLALSFGDYLPFNLNRILFDLPIYGLFRAPARHMYEFTFSLATLGGLGASYIARSGAEASRLAMRRGAIVFAAIVGVTVVVYYFFGRYILLGEMARPADTAWLNFEALVPLLVAAMSLAVFWLFLRQRLRNSYVGALMAAALFADMLVFSLAFNWGWLESMAGVKARLQDPPAAQFIKSRESDLNSFRIAVFSKSKPDREHNGGISGSDFSVVWGLRSVNGYNLMRLNRQAAVAGNIGEDGLISDSSAFGPDHQGLNLLNVKYALYERALGENQRGDAEFDGARWRKLGTFENVDVYENLEALPLAWFASQAAIGTTAEALETIKTGRMKDGSAFDPAKTVLLEDSDLGRFKNPQIAEPVNAEVKLASYEPQRIELRTRNQQPGFLTLSEVYYRGWEVWIDGTRAPVQRANHAFRGVTVPAGDHRIEFVFRGHSFRNGAAWSLAGVLLLLVGATGLTRRALIKIDENDVSLAATIDRLSQTGAGSKLRVLAMIPMAKIIAVAWSKLWAAARPRLVIIAAVAGLLIYGYVLVSNAAYGVGGGDTAGYAQFARALLKGEVIRRVPELDLLGLPDSYRHIFMPLGWDPGPRPGTMAPFYPIGLPLVIAAGALIGGWNYGPYLVFPALGLLGLILLYRTGLELGLSRGFSIAGALMLAVSPTYILYSSEPMSDGVAMFWSLSVILTALLSRKRAAWALLTGAAFGLAFLIRPSSVLLLLPLLFILPLKFKNILYFILGGLPLAVVFFTYNTIAYNHPLVTGYWATNHQGLMKTTGLIDRFNFYRNWVEVTMSPLPLLGWLVVAADRKVEWRFRVMLVSWFGAFFIFYSFYDIGGAWWYTRFLLPAYPAMILGALLVVRDLPGLLGKWISETNQARVRWSLLMILVAVTLSHEKRNIERFQVFRIASNEITHYNSASQADQTIPSHSLVAMMQMSGAMAFYTNRPVVRWDYVHPDTWPTVKKHAAERGYRWYALLEPFEIEDAQRRMGGKWKKVAMFNQVSLWELDLTAE